MVAEKNEITESSWLVPKLEATTRNQDSEGVRSFVSVVAAQTPGTELLLGQRMLFDFVPWKHSEVVAAGHVLLVLVLFWI